MRNRKPYAQTRRPAAAAARPSNVVAMKPKREPSEHQAAVLKFVREGRGHGFVSAVAGSGKTTTLELICAALATSSACFVAFNKHIRDELALRLPSSVTVATIHQMGLRTVSAALSGKKVQVDSKDGMVGDLVGQFLDQKFGTGELDAEDRDARNTLFGVLKDLVRFAKSSLVDWKSQEAIADLVLGFDLDVELADAYAFLPGALEATRTIAKSTGQINFDDMIWLPVVEGWTPPTFLWLMVDESQDLTPAQRELVLRMVDPRGGRAIFVGDPHQAIYAFAGADSRSVEAIVTRTNATTLPLSVCYRCPRSHIELAQTIVPHITAAPGAPEGVIRHIEEDELVTEAREGDLILCRTNRPLVEAVYDLIAAGIPARIKGRDIGKGLIAAMKKIVKARNCAIGDFLIEADNWKQQQLQALMERKGSEMAQQALTDKVESLSVIFQAVNPADFKAFEAEIKALFSDDRPSVTLSSVHRAKGLEAKRVFILRRELMPHKMARTEEQKKQEANIEYIAYTRAMEELVFVNTSEKRRKKEKGGAE